MDHTLEMRDKERPYGKGTLLAPVTVEEFFHKLCAQSDPAFSFDVEHVGNSKKKPNPEGDFTQPEFKLWGVSFAIELDGQIKPWFEVDLEKAKKFLEAGIKSGATAVAFNGKYDIKCLRALKMLDLIPNFADPMIGVNLLDDNRHPSQLSLEAIVLEAYGYFMDHYEDAAAGGATSQRFVDYTCDDAYFELALWRRIKPKLEEQGLLPLAERILFPCSEIFADMERAGVYWDCDDAKKNLVKLMEIRDNVKEKIFAEIGPLNLNSGDQLAQRLFHDLAYDTKGIDMTAGGKNKAPRFKTDAATMDLLAPKYPVCNMIRVYSTANQLIGTFIEPMTRRAIADPHSRVHASFWLTSATGRTRSSDPNLQNLPAFYHPLMAPFFEGIKVRSSIAAQPGRKLGVYDLSQIELRGCAHVSGDKVFRDAFRGYECKTCGKKGQEASKLLHECPHCGAAENEKILKDPQAMGFWHGKDLHTLTTDSISALGGDRQAGKKANFMLIYGAIAKRMYYEYPDLSIRQWEEAIIEYFHKYVGVKTWHHKTIGKLRSVSGKHCVITDAFGRKRRIPKRDVNKMFKHCLNMALNFPVQSLACEYLQLALTEIVKEFREMGWWMKHVFLVNFVHDEFVFEIDEDKVDEASEVICRHAESAVQLAVPVRMDYSIVDRWSQAK